MSSIFKEYYIKFTALFLSIVTAVAGFISPMIKPFVPALEADPVAYTGETLSLTGNSPDKYLIVTAAGCPETVNTAAKTLQEYLFKICGQTLEIVKDNAPEQATEILIGTTNRESSAITVDCSGIQNEGYIIKTYDKKLVITGLGNRGTIYGVYGFLEDVLGCRWYTKDLIVTPKRDVVKIPAEMDIKKNPYFELRETDWISPHDKIYSLANNINGDIYRQFDVAQGGNVKYLSSFAHTLTMQFAAPS
ncbi:MAG: alpha-glucuronidase family glycosyl hydrolase, partial [Eubacteriales bacterium]